MPYRGDFMVKLAADNNLPSGLVVNRTYVRLQGFIRIVAHVGSGDPVRVLRLYTMITLDEVCSIYC